MSERRIQLTVRVEAAVLKAAKERAGHMNTSVSAAIAEAFRTASALSPSSLPSTRVRQGPDASLNATPNFICGTVFTMAS